VIRVRGLAALADAYDLAQARKNAEEFGGKILELCVRVGGTITGEHGVGMEKIELMEKMFSTDSLEAMRRFKFLFDPDRLLNPGKVVPMGRGCVESRISPHVC